MYIHTHTHTYIHIHIFQPQLNQVYYIHPMNFLRCFPGLTVSPHLQHYSLNLPGRGSSTGQVPLNSLDI